jgi:hypothetical protein
MNYIVKMGLRAVMYVPSFIKIVSGIQNLIGRIHTHTRYTHTDRKAIS